MAAPTLDGTATGIATGLTAVSATLTTTATNDIICALIEIEQNGDLWVTGVSGGGLTWNKRTQLTTFPSSISSESHSLELWWAVAPTALAAVTITATANATFDDAVILVFGVSGCNITNPWDANASLAARNYFRSTATPTVTNISTTQANDFLIFGWGSNGNNPIGTVPTGFTAIGSRVNGGGGLNASVAAAYCAVTATQSAQTYAWGSTITGTASAVLFDALTADPGGSTTAPRPTYEVVTQRSLTGTNTAVFDTAGISANNVIVVLAYCEQTGGGPAITGISGGGLTWTRRSRSNASARGSLEVWSAQVTGTLAPSAVTVTYAASFDDASLAVLSLVGCHALIWDANAGLPAKVSNTAGGTWTPSLSVSTSQAHDLILAMTGTTNNAANIAAIPTGFQFLTQVNISAGLLYSYFGIGYQRRITTTTGATTAWGAAITDNAGGNAGGEYLIDALTADPPPVNFTTWNPSDKSANMTLTGGNLIATAASPAAGARAVHPKRSGKYYIELTSTTTQNPGSMIGFATAATALVNGQNASAIQFASSTTRSYDSFGGTVTSGNDGGFTTGSIVGVAVDLDNALIWFRLSPAGNWNNSAANNPATGVGGLSMTGTGLGRGIDAYPFVFFGTGSNSITANFGATAFTGAVPAGFTSGWDDSVAAVSNVVATQTAVLEFGSAPSVAQVTQAAILEFATPNPDAQLTQLVAEQWYVGVPDVQLTNIFVEQWAQVNAINTQAVLTQILLEEWTSVALAGGAVTGNGPMISVIT